MINGSSTTLNQLEVGLLMVRAMKSTDKPSLPLSVYGPTRLTHKAFHGVLITILDGRCPSFCVRLLFTWRVLHDFVIDWMVFLIPFHYIVAFNCIFETSMPEVLKIVMISHGCMPLQWLWYYEPSFIVNASFVFIELKFQSFIQDSIAFKKVFECNVCFLGVHNLFHC